jgi:protein-tyrosine phosphatase
MADTLRARGYPIHGQARQVRARDLEEFDLVLAMDRDNEQDLLRLATAQTRPKVRRFTEFCRHHDLPDVPDPYYGGPQGFEKVADIVEDGCQGLLAHVRQALEAR